MKRHTKSLLLIFLFILPLFSTQALENRQALKVGLGYSTADSYWGGDVSGKERSDYALGFLIGYQWKTQLHSFLDLQLEGNFNQKAYRYKASNTKNYKENLGKKISFQTLEFLLLGSLNFQHIKPYFGGFLSYTLFKKSGTNYLHNALSFDYGLTLGASFYYQSYFLDFRFNQGFGLLYDHTAYEYSNYNEYSSQFLLSFGYEF